MSEIIEAKESPAELIRTAITSGSDLEKLEKLLVLQERWEANEARKAYHRAMAQFKANPPKIDKDKKVSFETSKGKMEYSHATLGNVTEKISAELSKYGLSASWRTNQNGKISVSCRITHELGHSEETTLEADAETSGVKNSIQAIGSTITYLERYTLLALTGLATYDDDDGRSSVNFITEEEVGTLQKMIIEKGLDAIKLCKFLNVQSLERIPVTEYQKAFKAIETAKGKNANTTA